MEWSGDGDLNVQALYQLAREDTSLRAEMVTAGIDNGEALRRLQEHREEIQASSPAEQAAAAEQDDRVQYAEDMVSYYGATGSDAPAQRAARIVGWIAGLLIGLAGLVRWLTGAPYQPLVVIVVLAIGIAIVVARRTVLRQRREEAEARRKLEYERALQTQTRRRLQRTVVETTVREILRELANERPDHLFRTTLHVQEPQGLAEIENPALAIPTAGRARLERLFAAMPGGSIAISGPRGAGKTTLMRWFCPPEGVVARDRLAVLVPAPVDYDAREYVLHLFAELCRLVLGGERVAALRSPYSRERMRRGIRRRRLAPVAARLPAPLDPGDDQEAIRSYEVAWSALQDRAESHLQEIWFQQSYSTGWSGSLKAGPAGELGLEGSHELARHQMSFPDIVRDLREFVAAVPEGMRVVIGIDELDKMPSAESVQRFLNEIKVIFGMRDCFYLLSISEDAMSGFERRGLPLRDVFDSSFDEGLYVQPLDVAETTALLQRRLVGMPIPFIMLCHCVAGALPRDVVRVAREVVALNAEQAAHRTLGEVASRIMAADFEAKVRSALVVASGMPRDPATERLLAWLGSLQSEPVTAERLLATCRSAGDELGDAVGGDAGDVARLSREMVAFCLFAGTLLEVFADERTPLELKLAYEANEDGRRRIDGLAVGRQAFSLSPEAAWRAIAQFRADQGLVRVEGPPGLATREPGTGPAVSAVA